MWILSAFNNLYDMDFLELKTFDKAQIRGTNRVPHFFNFV